MKLSTISMKKIIIFIFILLAFGIYIALVRNNPQKIMQKKSLTQQTVPEANIKCSGQPTIELTEGPYYTTGSPENINLYTGTEPGTKLILSGYVLDTGCRPIANAWLDFWQANGNGEYDNSGYSLRGHQYTDEDGKYTLTTVIPAEYPGRTPHIHLKVQANTNSSIITSQLFIPGVAANDTDNIYDSSLLIQNVKDTAEGKTANYNFIITAK